MNKSQKIIDSHQSLLPCHEQVDYDALIREKGKLRDAQLKKLRAKNVNALEFDSLRLKIESDHDKAVFDIRQKQHFSQEKENRSQRKRAENAYKKQQDFK